MGSRGSCLSTCSSETPSSSHGFAASGATKSSRPRTFSRADSLSAMPIAIFDMDGVLYRGAQVLPYGREALDRLRRAKWDVFFAKNNSASTRLDYLRPLHQPG